MKLQDIPTIVKLKKIKKNSLVKDELSYQIGLKKDAITFGHNQAMQTMEAEGARRKSLFLTGMSMYKKSLIVSERALNAIGSSTEAVFESIKEKYSIAN